MSDIIRSTVPNVHKIFEKCYGDKMNYCDLNEYEDYIVYCINTTYNSSEMGGFPWMQGSTGSEAQVKIERKFI